MGIDYEGQVWGWGGNDSGQLGDNTTKNKCTPVTIRGTKKTFCSIAAGGVHTMGIDYTGQVWGWGRNDNALLGVYNSATPIKVCNI